MAQHFRQLIAWQKSVATVTEVHRLTKLLPREELYGLSSQMRRCAISIPSNIAEGAGRMTTDEFVQFLGHAYGSLCELETQMIIGTNLDYFTKGSHESLQTQISEVGRIVNGQITSLTKRKPPRSDH